MARPTNIAVALVALLTLGMFAPAYAGGNARLAPKPNIGRSESWYSSFKRNLTLRPQLRSAIERERSLTARGMTSAAASLARNTRERIAPMGVRERFAMWRSQRKLTRTAFRLVTERSMAGDTVGTQDALAALRKLDAPGRDRATKRAFKNALDVARQTSGKRSFREVFLNRPSQKIGDVDLGMENLAFATKLAKSSDAIDNGRAKVQRGGKTLVEGAFKMATANAKAGDPAATRALLERAALAAEQGKIKFDEKAANRILARAYEVNAKRAYKAGALDEAATAIRAANQIKAEIGDRPDRASRKLEKKLAPRIRALEAQERRAARRAQAAP